MIFIKSKVLVMKKGILLLSAFITSLAVSMNMEVMTAAEEGIANSLYQNIYKLIEIINQSMADRRLLITVLTIGLYLLYKKTWIEKNIETIKYSKGLSLFLSVMYAGGKAFEYGNSLSILYTSSIRMMKAFILIIGFYVFYLAMINYIYFLLHTDRDIELKENRIRRLYRKHPWLIAWVGIMLVFIFHILLRYPGVMGYDNWDELGYYFGYDTYTTAQPVFHTWILGTFVKFGIFLGSANLGLFLLVMFQALIMSAVLSYSLFLMKKWGVFLWIRILAMGIYCITPYYVGYVSFPVKDYLYTAFFLLFILSIMELIILKQSYWENCFLKSIWVISSCFMILFRKNGMYIYVPVICLLLIKLVKNCINKESEKVHWKKVRTVIICLILPLALAKGISGFIEYYYHVEQDSPKEMFSLPFQQTARYVRDYGTEVTEDEKQAIEKVLDYNSLAEIYSEVTADPVKTTYHAQNTKELMDYFTVWFRQFLKHPVCYIESFWNQNYYIFSLDTDNIVYNKNCHVGEEIKMESGLLDVVYFEIPEWMHGIDSVMVSYYSLMTRFPIIGMFSNVAFYIILMIVIIVYMLHDKCKWELLVMFPLLLSFFTVLLAPQIMNQPRYAFPIIYAMPTAVAFYCYTIKIKEVNL